MFLVMIHNAVLVYEEIHHIQEKGDESKPTCFIDKVQTEHQEAFVCVLLKASGLSFLFLFLLFQFSLQDGV